MSRSVPRRCWQSGFKTRQDGRRPITGQPAIALAENVNRANPEQEDAAVVISMTTRVSPGSTRDEASFVESRPQALPNEYRASKSLFGGYWVQRELGFMGQILKLGRGMTRMRRAASPASPRTPSTSGSFDALALLLAETAVGRETAFARLYELTAGQLFTVAQSIVGGRGDVAEDVLQDSFVRVWRWAHRYDPGKGTAYGWLLRIVRNRALTAREALHRREHGQDELQGDALVSIPPTRPSVARTPGGSMPVSAACRPTTAAP